MWVMKNVKITLRIHPIMMKLLKEMLNETIDITGFQHISMNHWITIAIKEKLERDKLR